MNSHEEGICMANVYTNLGLSASFVFVADPGRHVFLIVIPELDMTSALCKKLGGNLEEY